MRYLTQSSEYTVFFQFQNKFISILQTIPSLLSHRLSFQQKFSFQPNGYRFTDTKLNLILRLKQPLTANKRFADAYWRWWWWWWLRRLVYEMKISPRLVSAYQPAIGLSICLCVPRSVRMVVKIPTFPVICNREISIIMGFRGPTCPLLGPSSCQSLGLCEEIEEREQRTDERR